MAGKLPSRPMCSTHSGVMLQRNGSCFLCEGEILAREDKRKVKVRDGRKRPPSGDADDGHESEDDRTLAAVREVI